MLGKAFGALRRATPSRGVRGALRAVAVGAAVGVCASTLFWVAAARADPNFPVTTIGVGNNPYAVAVDPYTHNAYIANSGDGTVSVISETVAPVTGTVIGSPIQVGNEPDAVAVDPFAPFPANDNVYVANYSDDTVSVIDESGDANTGTVIGSPIQVWPDPDAIAVDPSSHDG